MLNIQVRVLGQQAAAQIKAIQRELNVLQKSVNASGAAAGNFDNRLGRMSGLEKFGKNLQWTGRQLEYNFTLPLVIAGAASTKWALDNEKAMTRVRKVYGDLGEDVDEELKAIERSFRLLSDRFGVHQDEVIGIGAAWAQAGAAGAALPRAVKATMEAMVLGELEATDAAQKMIAVQSAYRLNTIELTQAISDLNVIENQTSIDFGGLIDVIVRAGGAARTAGIDLRHLSAMAAVLVPAGGSASQAGNSLRTMMSRLLAPTKQAADLLNEMGLEIDSVAWLSKNGTQRLEALSLAFDGLTQNQKANISSAVASRWQINRFDLLMQDLKLSLDEATRSQSAYYRALEATEDQQKSAAITARELSTVLASSPRAFEILTTNIKNAMAEAILPLLPVMISLLNSVRGLVQGFNELDPATQQLIGSMLLLLAVVGPLGRYLGSVIILVTTLGQAVLFVGKIFMFLGGIVLSAVGGIISVLLGGVGLITTAFGGMFAFMVRNTGRAFVMMGDLVWQFLRFFIGPVMAVIRTVAVQLGIILIGSMISAMQGAAAAVMAGVRLIQSALVVLPLLATAVGTAVTRALAMAPTVITTLWAAATSFLATLWSTLPILAGAVGQGIRVAFLGASTGIYTAWVAISTALVNLWRMLPVVAYAISSGIRFAFLGAGIAVQTAWTAVTAFLPTLWATLPFLAAAVSQAIRVAWLAGSTAVYVGWLAVTQAIATLWAALPAFMASVMATVRAVWLAGSVAIHTAWIATQTAISTAILTIPALMASMWRTVRVIWTAGLAAIRAMTFTQTAFFAAIGQLWALALANPLLAAAVLAAAALVAIFVTLVVHFRDDIIGGIIAAFNMLPDGIKSTLMTVVRMIQSFAMAVYEWLSYLNPFARHSPSLVDQVTAGVSTILDQYARLNGVKAVIKEAVAAHNAFLAATGAASSNLRMEEYQKNKADIVAVSPGAGASVDAMVSSIMKMQGALQLVNIELQAQTMLVSRMEADITAQMQPINDEIWKNEQAQKRLRLEILRLEQTGQTIDGLRNKYAKLSGEIEKLRGDRDDLRLAGAGSDVLGVYDEQIRSLEAQRNAMEGMTSPVDDLQNKLNELQRQGEMMTLERDLRFDPQLRELDIQKQKLQDLEGAYRDIGAAIRDMEQALSSSASASRETIEAARKKAETAKKATELEPHIQQFRDAGMADFDIPGGSAPPGLGREGGLKEIEDFNKQMEAELAKALGDMGGFDMFGPLRDMWDNAWAWISERVEPVVGPVIAKVKDFFGKVNWRGLVKNPFAGFKLGGGGIAKGFDAVKETLKSFKNIAEEVWDFLVRTFGPVFKWIGDQVKKAGRKIGAEIAKFSELIAPAVEAFGHIANAIEFVWKYVITPIIVVALGVILAAWSFFWPLLANIMTPIIDLIINVITAGLQIIRGVIGFVLNLINGDWGAAWDSILTIVGGIWDAIWAVISFPVKLIWGLIKGLVMGVIGFFKYLWDVLVGHSIIPDMMNAIVKWFNFLLSAVKFIWNLLWTAIMWAWNNIAKPIFTGIKWVIDNVVIPAFRILRDGGKAAFTALANGIKWVWNNIIQPVWNGIKWFIENVLLPIFERLKRGLKKIWDSIGNAVSSVWGGIVKGIKAAVNTVIDVVNTMIKGINKIGDVLPGIDFNINLIPKLGDGGGGGGGGGGATKLLAAGGRIDPFATKVGGGFATNRVRAIVGEGNPLYPEYVIPTDPNYRNRALGLANSLAQSLGMEMHPPHFALGGLLDSAADLAGDAWDATGGKVASGIKKGAIEAAYLPFSKLADFLIGQIPWNPGRQTAKGVKNIVDNWVKNSGDKVPNVPDLTGFGYPGYQRMFEALNAAFPHARLLSGLRPGAITATGNASYHGKGRAIDTNPDMAMFDWINSNYGSASKELIFSPAGSRQIRNGAPHVYSGITRAMHWDHIHWAMAQGGIIPSLGAGGIVMPRPGGTLARLGERGQREAVVPLPRDFTAGGNTYNFYGDLSFPNIRSGDDAETFISNLEQLVSD